MATTYNAGFPAYGTAASQAASKTFQDNFKKTTEAEKKTKKTADTSAEKNSNAKKTGTTAAATYEKSTTVATAESYDKTGAATGTSTAVPNSQVSGFARAGAVVQTDYGKTVGEPKLSDEGAKYYEELKKKFKGLDFILVGRDSVQAAKAQQASYANGNRLVVLIDEDKIEQMAKDPKFRNYYEGIIKQAQAGQFAQAQARASVAPKTGSEKKGPNVLDNGAGGFLAASAKANKEFSKRIAKIQEKKKAAKKADAKKAEKQAKEDRRKERLEEGRKEHRGERRARFDEPKELHHVREYKEMKPNNDIPEAYRRKFESMEQRLARGEHPGEVRDDKEGAYVDYKA